VAKKRIDQKKIQIQSINFKRTFKKQSNMTDTEMKNESGEIMSTSAIDESLYSRQLYVMGHEAQRKMGSSTVLIVGLRGLGVEIAKNVILAGVQGVVLHDDQPVEVADLSAQFYFKESDVGKPRSAACASQLSELNNYVNVTVGSGKDCLSDMSKYACVLGDSNYVTVIKLIVIFIKRLPYDIDHIQDSRPCPRFVHSSKTMRIFYKLYRYHRKTEIPQGYHTTGMPG
jgi:hypothetical protein